MSGQEAEWGGEVVEDQFGGVGSGVAVAGKAGSGEVV